MRGEGGKSEGSTFTHVLKFSSFLNIFASSSFASNPAFCSPSSSTLIIHKPSQIFIFSSPLLFFLPFYSFHFSATLGPHFHFSGSLRLSSFSFFILLTFRYLLPSPSFCPQHTHTYTSYPTSSPTPPLLRLCLTQRQNEIPIIRGCNFRKRM